VLNPQVWPGLDGLRVGEELLVLTWLHRARRDVLRTRPRNDPNRQLQGVFTTRSPDRPNPLGLHRVRVLAFDGNVWVPRTMSRPLISAVATSRPRRHSSQAAQQDRSPWPFDSRT
jgi:tRNA (Thr-GGU) A37 N-methylase